MGYIFALLPPFLDSVAVFLDKFLLSKFNINSTLLTIYSGVFAFIVGIVIFLFSGLHIIDIKSAAIITLSGILGLFYLFTYFKALTYDEASRVGSLFQVTPVIVIIFSFIFLGEKLLIKQYIGAALIIFSGFLLSLKKLDSGILKINKAFSYMVISSIFSASVYVLFRLGVKGVGFWEVIPYEGLGNGVAALAIILHKDNLKQLRKSIKSTSNKVFIYITIVEFISRLSRYSLFFALTLLSAPIVSVLQGFQPLFLLVLGIILSLWFPNILKEVVTKQTITIKFISIVGIFSGLYLIFF